MEIVVEDGRDELFYVLQTTVAVAELWTGYSVTPQSAKIGQPHLNSRLSSALLVRQPASELPGEFCNSHDGLSNVTSLPRFAGPR